jgi:phosphate/sulfate permease
MCELDGYRALLYISIISAIVWNLCTRKYGVAFFGAWITSVIGLQISNAICIGYLDPFWPIAVVITIIPALFIVAIVSSPFMMFRYRQEQKKNEKKTYRDRE